METIAGIFSKRAAAEAAVKQLLSDGVPEENISFLTPGTTQQQLDQEVPTSETEQPGMGKALGGAVGGALGAAAGLPLGAAAASLLIPGIGPIIAAGVVGAALLGAGGAAAGVAAGGAMEETVSGGLPHDELFVYEDALRQGRTVVIVVAEDGDGAERVRGALTSAGAESLDAARESWWVGLRDAESEDYAGQGQDFQTDEALYRRGFEAALHPRSRGRSYADELERLRGRHSDACEQEAFRRGYERGQRYQQSLTESRKS